jgi:hypothetical protein
MEWVECPACGRVLDSTEFPNSDAINAPCPRCGGAGQARLLWPPYETRAFLKIVDAPGEPDAKDLRVRTLFLASACENLLADIVWDAMMQLRVPIRVADHLIESADGRARLIASYKVLTGISAQQVLQDTGMGSWFQSWETLTRARNAYGHGKWRRPGVSDTDATEACRVVRESFGSAFAALKNAAIIAALDEQSRP